MTPASILVSGPAHKSIVTFASMRPEASSAAAGSDDLHVALVAPEIPWNTGNAGRTCLAADARLHLVGPLGFSLADKQVRRAGLDYWPAVEPRLWTDWDAFEKALPGLGTPTIFSPEAERTFWEIDFPRPSVLIFGSESAGLPAAVRATFSDRAARIPQRPDAVRSLNLSTAVALGLYEARRRWLS